MDLSILFLFFLGEEQTTSTSVANRLMDAGKYTFFLSRVDLNGNITYAQLLMMTIDYGHI